eukprot:TRINITY_DN23419_c0_g1_i1.p1 TRINITY_DN23419_c0_g1~~TRINITY_DN23419_c0_g1_i1.p1  ORF type:complete len:358 (+),score=108.36 TRINITY_DN23419_c0_g1_i1:105-1178(+)
MADAWRAGYQDPFRWRFPNSKEDLQISGTPRIDVFSNENCETKALILAKPTHDAAVEKAKRYPLSEHLDGKRRLWEIRLQMRFKQVPEGQLFFGIELGQYVSMSAVATQAQKGLVSACQAIVGDCYHSKGDNPKKVSGEPEPPTFVMPLWAFDQFHVAEPGSEPDLASDLSGVGMRRSDSVSNYIKEVKKTVAELSTDKVYTFCFWGISQFLDIMKWEASIEVAGGLMPSLTLDFNNLCGSPPVFIGIYELPSAKNGETVRHLKSLKKHFWRVAVWSALKPPADGDWAAKEAAVPEPIRGADASPTSADSGSKTPQAAVDQIDLLGLSLDDKPKDQAGGYKAEKPATAESTDLLGLM